VGQYQGQLLASKRHIIIVIIVMIIVVVMVVIVVDIDNMKKNNNSNKNDNAFPRKGSPLEWAKTRAWSGQSRMRP
jgi:hypothetical protein